MTTFLSGIILKFKPLVIGAICCWVFEIMSPFINVDFHLLLIAGSIIAGWIIPGYLLKAKYKNGKITITFQYAGNSLKTSDGKLPRGFSLDGVNETNAIIVDKEIIIETNKKPEFVYYGWKPFTDANLVNAELLPASTFKLKVQ